MERKTSATTEVDQLVDRATQALTEYMDFNQSQIDAIVDACAAAGRDHHAELALAAVAETGRGNFKDKSVKNRFAAIQVSEHMRSLRTVGVIERDEVQGITSIAEPVGVVAGITPVTNPTSTTIFKALMALKTRNPIIFAFHPGAQSCSAQAAKLIRDTALSHGAPQGCVQWVSAPSKEATAQLMNHSGVAIILATGGNAMVQAAYSCGKPALGVGAGNVPAYVHASADLPRAIHDIVVSKSFDNGMICASEQAVIVDKSYYAKALEEFQRLGAYLVKGEEKAALEQFLFGVKAGDTGCKDARLNPNVVGQSCEWIAQQCGINIPVNTTVILAQANEVSYEEPLTREKLCPVLAILKSEDSREGIAICAKMVAQDGLGHSAVVHAWDQKVVEEFGHYVQAVRIIENAPASHGAIGGIYNAFIPSLTLGCGSYGHNSVSNNVSALNLINIKRIGRRNSPMIAFSIPANIFTRPGSLRCLGTIAKMSRISIITEPDSLRSGIVDEVTNLLRLRRDPVSLHIIDNIGRETTRQSLDQAIAATRGFNPDTIIALGTTGAINAAKIIRTLVAHPDMDAQRLWEGGLSGDLLAQGVQLVCVPTISGGQAAMSSLAGVVSASGIEQLISHPAFLADIAILDPQLTHAWDAQMVAERGFETIAQAVEAYLSVHASDFADACALKALTIANTNLVEAVKGVRAGTPNADSEHYRNRMCSAGSLAAAALGNTSLGLAYGFAQAVSDIFSIPRQRSIAIFLPAIVRFNSQARSMSVWPTYERYSVPGRCAEMTAALGLGESKDPVEALAKYLEATSQQIGLPQTLSELVPTKAIKEQTQTLTLRVFDYHTGTGNPRTPTLEEIEELLATVS